MLSYREQILKANSRSYSEQAVKQHERYFPYEVVIPAYGKWTSEVEAPIDEVEFYVFLKQCGPYESLVVSNGQHQFDKLVCWVTDYKKAIEIKLRWGGV